MNGRGEPNWQPISMLATIASLIDGGMSDAREHYAMLLKARPKPFVLDDATIVRTKLHSCSRVYARWCGSRDRVCPVGEALVAAIGADIVAHPHQVRQPWLPGARWLPGVADGV